MLDLEKLCSLAAPGLSWFWFLYLWMRYLRKELSLLFELESGDISFFLMNSEGFIFSTKEIKKQLELLFLALLSSLSISIFILCKKLKLKENFTESFFLFPYYFL